jgi:hypothetical protein
MASLIDSQVSVAIADTAPSLWQDVVVEHSKILKFLDMKPASNTKGPQGDVRVEGNSSATVFDPGNGLPTPGANTDVQRTQNWGAYAAGFSLNHQQALQLGGAGATAKWNKIVSELMGVGTALASKLHTDVIGGAIAANTISGLTTTNGVIDDAGTFAGINRATYTAWQCYVADNSGTPRAITEAIIEAAMSYMRNTREWLPGRWIGFTGSAQMNALKLLTTGAITQENSNVPAETSPVKVLGYRGDRIVANDIEIVEIPGYTTGQIDFVNRDYVWIEYLNDASAAAELFNANLATGNVSAMLGSGVDGSQMFHVLQDTSGDVAEVYGVCYPQNVISNSNGAFSIQDLS